VLLLLLLLWRVSSSGVPFLLHLRLAGAGAFGFEDESAVCGVDIVVVVGCCLVIRVGKVLVVVREVELTIEFVVVVFLVLHEFGQFGRFGRPASVKILVQLVERIVVLGFVVSGGGSYR
jgi:hypothetical protein